MNELLDSLFGLGELGFGADGVEFAFIRPLAGWALLGVLILAGAIAWWCYRRVDGPIWARRSLAVVRWTTLVLLIVLAMGPQLVRPNEREERDWVVMLLDRSASMRVADAPVPPDEQSATDRREPRDEQLRRSLSGAQETFEDMAERRRLLWLGFGAGAFDLEPASDGVLPALGEPDAMRTAIGASLADTLRRTAGRRVSVIVLATDGRSADTVSRETLRTLADRNIRLIAVPMGSGDPLTDLAIRSVEAPTEAFIDDAVPVRVVIDRLGEGAADATGTVELFDQETGVVLDRRELGRADPEDDDATEITLEHRPDSPGDRSWGVRIIPDQPDLSEENNLAQFAIRLVDRPLRVLYLDGYPRWEQRYFKNLLLRERSIDSSSLLVASDRRYIAEGDTPIRRLPVSPEEWAEFDVIVIGDMRAQLLGDRQMEHIREQVSQRGAGLVWLAGPGATPRTWGASPLGELLPFTIDAGLRVWETDITLRPTPSATRLGVLDLPLAVADPDAGWSRLRWAVRIDRERLKPAAEVLAEARPADSVGEPSPLVVTMRYGAGRVLFVGTDESWRWRFARGEGLTEQLWIPLVRLLGRESLGRGGRRASLDAQPATPLVDQPVRIRVRLLEQSLIDRRPERIRVRVTPEGDARAARDFEAEVELLPEGDPASAVPAYTGVWSPARPGRYLIEPGPGLLDGLELSVTVDVATEDDELRRPDADHEFLASLADQLGELGVVLDPSELHRLPELAPARTLRVELAPDTASLWDRPAALALLLALLTLEWVGRRLLSLS